MLLGKKYFEYYLGHSRKTSSLKVKNELLSYTLCRADLHGSLTEMLSLLLYQLWWLISHLVTHDSGWPGLTWFWRHLPNQGGWWWPSISVMPPLYSIACKAPKACARCKTKACKPSSNLKVLSCCVIVQPCHDSGSCSVLTKILPLTLVGSILFIFLLCLKKMKHQKKTFEEHW